MIGLGRGQSLGGWKVPSIFPEDMKNDLTKWIFSSGAWKGGFRKRKIAPKQSPRTKNIFSALIFPLLW
jgi:hypothetical protein